MAIDTRNPDGRGPHRLADLEARTHRTDEGHIELRSPAVGLWREGPAHGHALVPGECIGRIEVLGRFHRVFAPRDAGGLVVHNQGEQRARLPVGFDSPLLRVDPSAGSVGSLAGDDASGATSRGALTFDAPSAGRFYAKPGPDKPAFVNVGDEIQSGQTIAILEVMKTFNRIAYGGVGLPDRAKVVRIVPADGDDVERGSVLLELEAID